MELSVVGRSRGGAGSAAPPALEQLPPQPGRLVRQRGHAQRRATAAHAQLEAELLARLEGRGGQHVAPRGQRSRLEHAEAASVVARAELERLGIAALLRHQVKPHRHGVVPLGGLELHEQVDLARCAQPIQHGV